MSDTGKTVLWIVVAVVVIAVIIWLFVSAARRREAEARRLEAGNLRARVQERLPEVQRTEDRASVTAAMAADARAEAERQTAEAERQAAEAERQAAEADRRAAEARRLEEQAQQHRATAESARVEHADLEREADRVDPDVRTDDEGHRVDGSGTRPSGQESPAVGSAAFTTDDDEDDLADAENPFAPTTDAETAPVATGEGTDLASASDLEIGEHDADESSYASEEPEVVSEGPVGTGTASEQSPDERPSAVSDQSSSDIDDTSEQVPAPPVADAHEPKQVEVPALAERDDVIADGGTPANDPGDHRGQAWATTPGDRGLDDATDDGDAADEGLDVDMAPHSHESDEDDELAEPASDDATESARGGATDTAWTDAPDSTPADDDRGEHDEHDDEEPRGAAPTDTAWSVDDSTSGRRMSSFDEVVDGGFGIGSAAPIADGAQPLGHAVKGRREGTTFLGPDDAGYDDVEPDVWFYNEEAARRAGFHREGE